MFVKLVYTQIAIIILFAASFAGCKSIRSETTVTFTPAILETTPAISETSPILPTSSTFPTGTPPQPSPAFDLSEYAFPDSIDPAKQYLFYLHGRIIEDQGIPAISPDFGEYEYEAILEKLSGNGFVVLSEQRPKNTDSGEYARKITEQVTALLNAGVPAKYITVVGASKGAAIAMLISNNLDNKEINYVLLGGCNPATVEELRRSQLYLLYGNVLSIYDSADELAGSCQELFSASEGKGISRYDEVILNIGTGHGILYKPLDEWIIPTVQWAREPSGG